MTRPYLFDGLKVLDIASYIAAPAAATMLADFGADVVKIEPPEGDPYRAMSAVPGMPVSEHNYSWVLTSRNKRSLALDLKVPEGQKVLQRIVPAVDVLITNFPADVRPRLGLAYEQVAPLNRRLIYASLTGYGETGPEASRPAYDANAWWARSGLMDLARAEAGSLPVRSVPGMGDHPTAAALYGAIVTALYQRERTGQGAQVGTSLLANGAWANGVFIQAALCGATFLDRKPRHAAPNALGNIYQCLDGRWFILSLLHEEKTWPVLVAKLGSPELGADPRFATRADRRTHAQALIHELDRIFAGRDAEQWHQIFEAAGLTAGVVQRVTDVPDDRQMALNQVLAPAHPSSGAHLTVNSPIWMDRQDKVPPRPAPGIGEHTRTILLEYGFATGEIESLRAAGVIVSPE